MELRASAMELGGGRMKVPPEIWRRARVREGYAPYSTEVSGERPPRVAWYWNALAWAAGIPHTTSANLVWCD